MDITGILFFVAKRKKNSEVKKTTVIMIAKKAKEYAHQASQ
jgi:hypothetical protein